MLSTNAIIHWANITTFQVAFDVVLATAVVPLFGAYYSKKPSPVAALLSILVGGCSRIIMEVSACTFPVLPEP
jgi:Na+/pantothenate symporter